MSKRKVSIEQRAIYIKLADDYLPQYGWRWIGPDGLGSIVWIKNGRRLEMEPAADNNKDIIYKAEQADGGYTSDILKSRARKYIEQHVGTINQTNAMTE